ncbi:MAG TPA: undecaprenyl-diphosphate phosphatase [Acidimicrobiales bacterium]|nr:undecaprenyl-diphosphate phosphatase [Acidimicrobiales bacterium]
MHLALAAQQASQASHHLTFFQSIVIGIFQGIAELFPVSSLGHTVLIPKLFGWNNLVTGQAASESFYLAFIVGLHVANALALLVFFWQDWVRIVKAFFVTLRTRRVETSTERLAWLIVVASIPTGILGVLLEHILRTQLAKPLSAAIFLMINGLILYGGERVRRQSAVRELAAREGTTPEGSRRLDTLEYREAGVIGAFQTLALIAGISRDGIVMVAGLVRGLDNEDAARFAFLLATPIILAAGLYKIPDLMGANGNGVRGQVLAGSVVTFFVSLVSVRYLTRYFKRGNLIPFSIYCLAFGAFMVIFITAGL